MMQQAVGLAPDINVLEAMNIFKNFPDEELPKYRNDPKLALFAAAEMDRRLRVRRISWQGNKKIPARWWINCSPN